jgi:hypothetical protein
MAEEMVLQQQAQAAIALAGELSVQARVLLADLSLAEQAEHQHLELKRGQLKARSLGLKR